MVNNLLCRILIPLVQGRFLFFLRMKNGGKLLHLNPFGSGTFFIQMLADATCICPFILIPLVQGRFLFLPLVATNKDICILIPLVQGRFLFDWIAFTLYHEPS